MVKLLGSLMAIFAGAFVLLTILTYREYNHNVFFEGTWDAQINFFINLTVAVLAIFGGLVGAAVKWGLPMVFIAGLLSISVGILWAIPVLPAGFQPASLFERYILEHVISNEWMYGITLEAILMLIGSAFMLSSSYENEMSENND